MEERQEKSEEILSGPDRPLEMINLHITTQMVAFLQLYCVCGFIPVSFFFYIYAYA